MSNPKKNILAKLLPEGSQTLEENTNLANKINGIFLEPQQAYEPLNKNKRLDFTNATPPIITTETVFSLLNKINTNKSNGLDNIPNWVLKEYTSILAVAVTSLMNSSLNEQTLPQIWKSADVTPIAKNSQVERISNDLRPISLTPTLSKIAEDYIVHVHVKPAVLEQIGKDQFECTQHSFTSHALINMIHQWTKATDSTGASVRVFVLDYKKAFDLIDHNILINKLSMYKINPFVVNWICDFLSNRHQRVKLAEDCFSEWKTVPTGVPQGTKLGPWLFIIMINDLEVTSSNGVFKYVNDTTTHEVVKKRENSQAQMLLDEINDWSIANKFQLHPQKCKELRISFTRDDVSHEDVLIDQSTLNIVESVKILGVTIQNNLKWNLHIKDTIKKAPKRLYFLKQFKWAKLSTEELVKFYVTSIQSVILHACQVYHYSIPEYLSKSLKRVQRRALRIIHGYDYSYKELLGQSKLTTLSERRSDRKFFDKIMSDPQNNLYKLLPFNDDSHSYDLRRKGRFYPPKCAMNRHQKTFIVSASQEFNINLKTI